LKLIHKYYRLFYRALLIAILVLTSNQLFIQFWLNKKNEEGLIINVAGRQRMLSQRINLLILRDANTHNKELDSLLSLWKKNHTGLLETNASLSFHAINGNTKAKEALLELSENIEKIESLIQSPHRPLNISAINELIDHYLIQMDQAVFLLSKKADRRLSMIVIMELALFAISIAILFIEMRFIFLPVIKKLGFTIDEKDTLLKEKRANVQWRYTDYLKALHAISISKHSSEDKIRKILDIVKSHFDLPLGIVSKVENEFYTVVHCTENDHRIHSGDTYALSNTICDITLHYKKKDALFEDEPLFYSANLKESPYADHNAVKSMPFKTYIGIAIHVSGRLYGTINFSSVHVKRNFEEEEILLFLQAKEAIVYELQLIERRVLQEENEELAFIVKSTENSIIITDDKACITWTNDAFEKVTGYHFDEVAGKVPGDFLQGPKTDVEAIAQMRRAIKEKKSTRVEVINYHKTGKPFWTSIDLQPIFNRQGKFKKYLGIQSNITDQVNLRLENEQLALVARKTNSAIIILDDKGKIQWVNQGFINLTGYTFEEIIGTIDGYLLLGPQTQKADVERIKRAIIKGKSLQMEILIYNKKGDPYWVAIDLQPIRNDAGRVERFVILQTDITEKINIQKNKLISEIRGEEKERNRISEDLHDGVGQMLVASRLLLNKLKEDTPMKLVLRQRDVLDTLIKEMISETRLIINSLGVSLDESKNFKEALNDLIEKSYRVFDGKIHLKWEGDETFEDFIYSINLFRIIQEALNNSIKYSCASNITVSVCNNGKVGASIEDDGEGFDLDTSDVLRGSGLKNMKSRAANINLEFRLHSEKGKGTKISLDS